MIQDERFSVVFAGFGVTIFKIRDPQTGKEYICNSNGGIIETENEE